MTRYMIPAIALSLLASAAPAAPPTMTKCPSFLCVYDDHNTVIGVPALPYEAFRKIGQYWYGVYLNDKGPIVDYVFLYTSADCSGQKYMEAGYILNTAFYDGTSFWAPVGDSALMTYNSYEYGYTAAPYCQKNAPGTEIIAPAKKVETVTFYPPLTVK